MWKYVKRYLHFGIIAALFMVGEVLMDLLQPEIMSGIVDDGVLGVNTGGVGNLSLIWSLGLKMICLVLFGGLCGSLNNVFVHMTGQNIGNEMRKDAFRNIMTFSFPQVDRFGAGSLVTRVTNDITQVQNLVSQFVRGLIRTSMLTFGSIFFMFRLNQRFGLIVLCAFPLIVGCLVFCLSKANPLFSKLQTQLDKINSIMQEDVSGIRMIKACVREIYEKVRFGKANDQLIQTQLRVLTIFAFMNPVMNGLMYVVVTVILVAGSYEVGRGTATPGSSRQVLKNISLRIRAGETVAIMGTTGCGKSSLVSLIPRFYDVSQGSVLVDGVDVREYDLKALREKIAVALQKSELFSRTISENIAWGNPEAGEAAIVRAACAAQASGFIENTPEGYGTMVAERGMSLSGGQKQRLSIARAIVKDAEILIFDDATSALDLKTEADLYTALEDSSPNCTKIIIAQRIASVRRADRIVVLENGAITACGTHRELLESCRAYRDICESLMGEEEHHG